jgi:hypothetical protein
VRDKETPFTYYDHAQYFYHTKREAIKLFKERLEYAGKTIVKE